MGVDFLPRLGFIDYLGAKKAFCLNVQCKQEYVSFSLESLVTLVKNEKCELCCPSEPIRQ